MMTGTKLFLLCCLMVVATNAASVVYYGYPHAVSSQYRSQDSVGNYAFGYDEGRISGASFRRETGSAGKVAGSYGLAAPDGSVRVVNYVADEGGFRARVSTTEDGVEAKNPANVEVKTGEKPKVVPHPFSPVITPYGYYVHY